MMTQTEHNPSNPGSNLLRAKRRMEKLNRQRLRLLPRALLLGVFSGLMAVAFAKTMDAGEKLRLALLDSTADHFDRWGVALSIAFSVATISLAVWLVRFFAPAAAGSGIPHLKGVLLGYRSMVWYRVLWVKFVGGVIGVTGGLTLGREGPTVQMGGALGQMLGSRYHSDALEKRSLIAAGAGAGLSAIFNAPLAGVVFVLEELQGSFTPLVFFAALIASMTADVLSRGFMGQNPVFHVTVTSIPDLASLHLFLMLGILAGVLGVLFNRALLTTQRLTEARSRWLLVSKCVSWGVIIGLIGWWMPEVCGGGQPLVQPAAGATHPERAGTLRSLDAGFPVRPALSAHDGQLWYRRCRRHLRAAAGTRRPAGIVDRRTGGSANWGRNGFRWSRRNHSRLPSPAWPLISPLSSAHRSPASC